MERPSVQKMNELDLNIIKRIQDGNVNDFEHIINKYKDRAMTLTMRILKNTEDAEDSLQEAFIKAFRAIADYQFQQRSKFSTYFYRIVYNTAVDFYKKHKTKSYNIINIDDNYQNQHELSDSSSLEVNIDSNHYFSSAVYQADKQALDSDVQNLINKYLDLIPDKYSAVLTMFYINELSLEEISQILNLPLGTVKNRIFRAKQKLKEIILDNIHENEILNLV